MSDRSFEEMLADTLEYWRRWISRCTYEGRWREVVHRSALVLKLMVYDPTGALVAAPTMGLPEWVGGVRNWDYRYTWLRHASLTLYALLSIGFDEEARNFMGYTTAATPTAQMACSSLSTVLTAVRNSRRPCSHTSLATEDRARSGSAMPPKSRPSWTSMAPSWTLPTSTTSLERHSTMTCGRVSMRSSTGSARTGALRMRGPGRSVAGEGTSSLPSS